MTKVALSTEYKCTHKIVSYGCLLPDGMEKGFFGQLNSFCWRKLLGFYTFLGMCEFFKILIKILMQF
jgi:hypothetical protein